MTPRQYGKKAFREGKSIDSTNYPKGSKKWMAFRAGFRDAEDAPAPNPKTGWALTEARLEGYRKCAEKLREKWAAMTMDEWERRTEHTRKPRNRKKAA